MYSVRETFQIFRAVHPAAAMTANTTYSIQGPRAGAAAPALGYFMSELEHDLQPVVSRELFHIVKPECDYSARTDFAWSDTRIVSFLIH